MGKRGRRQGRQDSLPRAPERDYSDSEGNVLTLRGALSPGSRREYETALSGNRISQEDAWQRAFELLFERLAVRWTISGVPTDGQKHLLARLRIASASERSWVREVLREHCAELFPDLQAP